MCRAFARVVYTTSVDCGICSLVFAVPIVCVSYQLLADAIASPIVRCGCNAVCVCSHILYVPVYISVLRLLQVTALDYDQVYIAVHINCVHHTLAVAIASACRGYACSLG